MESKLKEHIQVVYNNNIVGYSDEECSTILFLDDEISLDCRKRFENDEFILSKRQVGDVDKETRVISNMTTIEYMLLDKDI